ncbi:hypothetical protein TIN2_6 [Tsukamurella phage TIN2]|uniref:Capsid maturation protease n=1 Tax=Tsukamurella phage TIN2 TaxID=1636545 RepID=A0A0K0N549_9CAUD|nr:head maturation protease [Tsukamurella phage TIN2]AKJ71696.1 hypothetical protein TIN2_6 [Tsukamurella phage TIN2]
MTTNATLSDAQRRNCVFMRDLGAPVKAYEKQVKNEAGEEVNALIIEGKAIFRSGTFADSEGYEHTWESLHINQMVDHDALLRGRGIFEDIPVRKGHPDWGGIFSGPNRNAMDELIGYMSNLRAEDRKNPADGNTYTYLLADLEILEETAIKNIKSGLWRNVSAEISTYVTNGNAEYWPVMYGVAYVDIPAVEGLKSQHSKAASQFSIILEEDMTQKNNGPEAPSVDNDKGTGTPENTPTRPQAPEKPENQFSIGGKKTADFAAVQAHIDGLEQRNKDLEQFRVESIEAGKADFVKSLVSTNKIPATSEEAYLNYAKSLDDKQYSAWKGLEEAKPAMSITAPQGAGFAQSHEQVTEVDAKDARVDVLKGIVSQHQLGGKMKAESIKETASYKELISLDPSFTL